MGGRILQRYFAVEGPDGVGKTTLIDTLEAEWVRAWYVREPRRNVEYPNGASARETALLFTLDRYLEQSLHWPREVTTPIISDRSVVSTLVGQAGQGGLTLDEVWSWHRGLALPGTVFHCRLSPEETCRRLLERGDTQIMSPQESSAVILDTLRVTQVTQRYEEVMQWLTAQTPLRVVELDMLKSPRELAAQVIRYVDAALTESSPG